MKKHIINISEIEQKPFPGEMPEEVKQRYGGSTMGFVGPLIGAEKLGYNITVVPAGKRAFPFHNHAANEEMFFILEGEGEIRLGEEQLPVKKGDIIACPSGTGKEHAHQIINTSKEALKYLAVSTKISPEMAEYPDTGKFGILGDNFRFVGRAEDSLDYWEGN
jgi:uncharacterized cupin superfamily protein